MIRILFIPVGSLTLLISEIILITASFVLASFLVLQVDPTDYLLYDGGLMRILPVLLCILLGMYFHDLYSGFFVKSRILLAQQLCLVMGSAFLLQGMISYVNRALRMPVRVMVVGSFLSMLLMYVWRVAYSGYAVRAVGRERLLLVGSSPVLADIAEHVAENPEKGIVVTGYVEGPDEPAPGVKVLGPLAALREIVAATRPDRIVVGMFERRNRLPMGDLLELRFAGHIIEEAATAYERVCSRVCVKELRPSQLIYSGELGPRRQILTLQRLSHLALSAIGLILASPLMLLAALAVRLSSPGPVLYRQKRVGRDGVPFTLYKFRSMREGAEAETGAVWAARDDPRATGVGRFLRRFRLDEMPQLFNVLKGEMSIVGPRPERPEFVHELCEQIPYYRQRHCVRPGITGWAQINYKYGDTLEDAVTKLEYDLYYIKNMSMSLDTYVILHTIRAMVMSRGAQ